MVTVNTMKSSTQQRVQLSKSEYMPTLIQRTTSNVAFRSFMNQVGKDALIRAYLLICSQTESFRIDKITDKELKQVLNTVIGVHWTRILAELQHRIQYYLQHFLQEQPKAVSVVMENYYMFSKI